MEFDSRGLPESGKKYLKGDFKDRLTKFNAITGEQHKVNSGYRSTQHNRRIGGAEGSAHVDGYAADIRCLNNSDRFRYLFAAIEAGFTRIGIDKRFIHLDSDPNKQQEIIWMY